MPTYPDLSIALFTSLIVVLLGFAAWRDVATRTIPDQVSIALIGLGGLIRLLEGWQSLGASVLVALCLFLVLLPLCSRGLLGGADLKLLAALAVGLPPLLSLALLSDVTMFGGVLAALYIVLRRTLALFPAKVQPRGKSSWAVRRIINVENWRIRRRAPLPYGIAIAFGAVAVIFQNNGV